MVARNNENTNNESEHKEILVSVRRVAKVVKGGRRFGFSVVVVAGNGKGQVGYGLGKAKEVMEAKTKASQAAKKNMVKVSLKESRTIHHDIVGHSGAGRVLLRSAPAGTGIIAGGSMRAVFEMLGLHDVVAKSLGSSNVHNMVGATFDALTRLSSPKQVAERRNKKVSEVYGQRKAKAE
ncbi:MAG: 30S ribosomal protein S5 [Rickettsiales bacterium]